MTVKEKGDLGEEYTARYLTSRGCEILCRNFRIRGGEIDIIARLKDTVHIVEVKTRKKDPLVNADRAITKAKQNAIIRATKEYINRNSIDADVVFDVAEVEMSSNGRVTGFRYIQRAFTA